MSRPLLSEEWRKVREAPPEREHNPDTNNSASLYERLQEQKRKQMEQELEEAKACTIKTIDLTHLIYCNG